MNNGSSIHSFRVRIMLALIVGLFFSLSATTSKAANTTVNDGVTAFIWNDQILVSVLTQLAKTTNRPSAALYCQGVQPVGYAAAGQDSSVVNYLVPTSYTGKRCSIQVVSGKTYDTHQFRMPDSLTVSASSAVPSISVNRAMSASSANGVFDIYSNIQGYDIIVVGGQSNASNSGVGPRVDPLNGVIDSQIMQMTCDDLNGNNLLDPGETSKVVSAFDYVHDCFSGYSQNAAFVRQTGRFGFAISFARQYAMRNLTANRKVLIVAGGVPGSGSVAWLQGPSAYLPNLLARVKTAMALPGKNRVVAFLWSQGEAEIYSVGNALAQKIYNQAQYDQYVSDYANRLTQIITSSRAALGVSSLPFLITEHAPQWTAFQQVKLRFQDVDRWVAATMGRAAVVSADSLPSNPLCTGALLGTFDCEDADHIHFSAKSHIDLGARMYQTLQFMYQSQ